MEEKETHLKDYLLVLKKRLWSVVTFFILVVTLVSIHTFTAKPLYQATSQILIERENVNVVSFEEVMSLDAGKSDYLNTQYRILKSRSLARNVFASAGLEGAPQYAGIEDPITRFLQGMFVKPVPNSRLVDLVVEGGDPKAVSEICNLWARTYIDENLQNKLRASSDAVGWLSEKVEGLQEKVQISELALQKYKEENKIISLEEKQNIDVQKLSELSSSVIIANGKRISVETRYRQLKDLITKNSWESLTNIIENSLIQNLKNDLVDLERDKAKLSMSYKPKHPKMAQVISQMNLIKRRLKEEVEKAVKKAENEFKLAKIEEETLRRSLEEQKRESLDMNKRAIKYNVLKREAEGNQKLFDVLLNRLKETSLTEGLESNNIRVVDYAEVPIHPVKPRKKKNILLAIIIGLMGGCSLAFLIEYFDDSIKTSEDVQQTLELPFLGPIPFTEIKDEDSLCLKTHNEPKSQLAEAFRGIRTSVLFSSSSDRALKTIMVTSSGPSEGKSTTAVNLAIAMANGGKKVLIVDCDLRKPTLHNVFAIPGKVGISNLLVDESKDIRDAVHSTDIKNLKVITCGPIPPNPSELLGSHRMEEILATLESKSDIVILDSPPIMSVTDSSIVSRMVEGVVLVVNSKKTSREAALRSQKILDDVGANLIGVVLNQVDFSGGGYYSYYSEYGNESA